MKSYTAVAIFMTILTMGAVARAQACYTPVSSLEGNYSLSESASGITCLAGTAGSCSINESSAATVNMNVPFVTSCSSVSFYGVDSVTSLSLSASDAIPCPLGGPRTVTIKQPLGGSSTSTSLLTITPTNSTYVYEPAPLTTVTITDPGCGGGGSTKTITGPLYPQPPAWPFTFTTLPPNVQPLSTSQPFKFDGEDNYFFGTEPWQLSFTLNPIYTDCDPCKKSGGQGVPVNSTISSQNQSLGEDIPVVGTGFHLHYESDRLPGAGGSGLAIADAAMIGGWTLSVHHAFDPGSNTLYLGDGSQRNGYQMGAPVTLNGDLLVTSESGSEVYVFDLTNGHHLQTLRSLTGALKYQFGYDAAGVLVTVTDASGNVTTIQRDVSEHPIAIVSPFGQSTSLAVDANSFLRQVTDPAGNTQTFTNDSTGLMQARTDANGNASSYSYDGQGHLATDADSIGGYVTLGRTNAISGFGYTVGETTSMGRTSSYQTTLMLPWIEDGSALHTEQHTNLWPDGLQASGTTTLQNGQISEQTTLPDGTSHNQTLSPDPRFGLQWPVLTSETLTQGSLTMNITGSRTASFTAGNPFSLTTQTDTETFNGRKYTSVFTASTNTLVDTSPVKRPTTTILDSLERVSSVQVGALLPVQFAYDTNGRLSTITQGTRKSRLTYDANGFLASSTDPLQQTTNFTHDAAGRLATETLPDGRIITYTYDANGNLTSVTPPGESAHDFSYTAVDLMSTYTPPNVPGTGANAYSYNVDRDLTKITRPDGQTIEFGYDSAGRLSSTTTPTETITYSYDTNTGNLSSASINGGEAVAYGYNGPLPTSSALTGTVSGTVSRVYNNNFWVTSESINGGNTVNFTYDNDGLITKAGALTLKLDPKDGLIKGSTLGSVTDSLTYDTFGELIGYAAKHGTTVLYNEKYTRDADGRISGKAETIGGKKNAYTYSYDAAGRLTGVKKNGVGLSSYTYDSNSNRLSATTSSGTVTGTYDAQDRLLTYGNTSYTYTPNGELASQTVGSQTTTYTYDVLGNLTAVTLPNGTAISYIVDAKNRRVGKQINGALVAGYLYDSHRIVAQLNSSNAIISQFIYGSGSTSPDYFVQGGVTYRIFSDQLGSPRLVVNTSTGAIAEQIDYDEFGNVVDDTNPGFQPFGLAGGLYDQDTKLVRFGARDYNPAVGRWTVKDPILFAGGDTNLYGYVLVDPVNMTDPSGLEGESCACKMKNYAAGFIDEYVNLQSTIFLGGLTPVIRYFGGVGIFGNTGQAIGNLTGRGNSVDTNSTSYTAGQLTVEVGTAVANVGVGLLGGFGANGARVAAANADDAAAKEFIERQFGKNAKDAVETLEQECKRRFVKPGME
jgi:RHS repeat-associated protein